MNYYYIESQETGATMYGVFHRRHKDLARATIMSVETMIVCECVCVCVKS